MPKIARKISVFGDSVSSEQPSHWGRAQYIAGSPGFGAGYRDYAVGGQRAQDTLAGIISNPAAGGAPMFGGLNFEQYIKTVDDSDIVLIALGGNDAPFYAGTYAEIPATALPEEYIGSEYLHIAEALLQMYQHAKAAGKRVAMNGMPYLNIQRAIAAGGIGAGLDISVARGFATKLVGNNVANRLLCGFVNIPFIATYGSPTAAGQPAADYNSTTDGLHPTSAYSNAVNMYVAAQLKTAFGL